MQNHKQKLTYTIYCHEDTDGGVAASILGYYLRSTYGKEGWNIDFVPVSHNMNPEWTQTPLQYPAAILDFTLHPQFFNPRYHAQAQNCKKQEETQSFPPCFWIDHHPTGGHYPFITEENYATYLPSVKTYWDTQALSTPGLMRAHYKEIGIPENIIQRFEEFIDLAEIVDAALYATPHDAYDFSHPAVKLQCLFNTSHPSLNRQQHFKHIVRNIMHFETPSRLFDSDPLYAAIIKYEEHRFKKQCYVYQKFMQRIDNVVVVNFMNSYHYEGMGRFIPYIFHPDAEYSVHILPQKNGTSTITCGVNPWLNARDNKRHIGNYFAQNFEGGGHSFVAGGKIPSNNPQMLKNLLEFLRS